MREEYIYDKDKVRFRRVRNSMWKWARRGVIFIIATMSMTVLYYVLFALLFSTETERRLKAENDMYERELPELERKERLLADVVDGLKLRDDRIYEAVFHASAPEMDPMSSVDFLAGIDSVQSDNIVHYVDGKLDRLDESAARVEDNFRTVMDVIRTPGFVMPPMTNPIRNFTFAQTGVSRHTHISYSGPSADFSSLTHLYISQMGISRHVSAFVFYGDDISKTFLGMDHI